MAEARTSSSARHSTSSHSSIAASQDHEKPVNDDVDTKNPDLTLTKTTSSAIVYPSTQKAILTMIGVMAAVFLISLDRLIVGVAIPQITNQFNSLGDVGWYGSAYFLTSCGFALLLGRVYGFYNPKWVFLIFIAIFEIGSAVCGAAPTSEAFIVGRAVQGLGQAGLMQGGIVIILHIVPLHKRPQYTAFFGLVFGVSSAIGPLLGGAFTDGPGWRWCFYINLPIGAVVIVILFFFLEIPSGALKGRKPMTYREQLHRLDPIGLALFLPCIICLLLALQWGGSTYNWTNARIIVLFILFGLLLIGFCAVQVWKGENATTPLRIVKNRSILAACWFSFMNYGGMIVLFYYVPIWFQAVKGVSAVKSGIMNLPMVLGLVITSIIAGILTRKIGYYAPWMIIGSVMTAIGAGLISTWTVNTTHSAWIGYQVLFGLGCGLGMQQPNVAAQTVLKRQDASTGVALVMFFMLLGGTIFLSVAQNLFISSFAKNLSHIPGLDASRLVNLGATDLRKFVTPEQLPEVLVAYNNALRVTFYVAIGMSCASLLGALAIEWKSVKQGQKKPPAGGSEAAPEQNSGEKEAKDLKDVEEGVADTSMPATGAVNPDTVTNSR